jgi:hypothetical protein
MAQNPFEVLSESKNTINKAAGAAFIPNMVSNPGLEILSTTNGVRNTEVSKKCYKSAVAAYVSLKL